MGKNCAPLVADLFLYRNERDFKDSLINDNQSDVNEALDSTSRYLDHRFVFHRGKILLLRCECQIKDLCQVQTLPLRISLSL